MSQSRGGDAEPGSETLPRGGQAEAHSRRRALEAFNGRWVLSESHGLDGFLQTMGMGFVGRSLAAAIPLANEIRFEQTADTSVMHVELQAPGRRFIYEHRLGGGGYEYRRPDNGHMEIANTVWDGDRLVTITQPSQPLVLPMRSERWLDSRNNMVIAHRICPTAPALLHFAMNPSPEACVSMRRIYRRCVQPPSALPSLPALSIPLAAVLPNVPKAAAEAAQR